MRKYSQIKKEKRINFLKKVGFSAVIVILVILAGSLTSVLIKDISEKAETVAKIEEEIIEKKPSEVSLVMVGDNLIHLPLVKSGEKEDGTYNFDFLYDEMKPYFSNSDISVIVQETVLGGKELGYSGYPVFNSPQEVGDSIKNAGFDVVLHATNHTLDKGAKGVENTLEFWKNSPEVTVLGINESKEAQNQVTYYDKNNIRFAFLNYTDSTNGYPLPKGKEYLVNVVDEEKIINDLITAESNADFTVVFMHWGIEYQLTESNEQSRLAAMMCENGADLIIGSHPHVIQPVKWITAENGNKTLVYYSLGNYISRQKEANNLLGIMAGVKIYKDTNNKVFVKEASVMPLVTHYNKNSRGFRVYPLKNYTDDLANLHGVSQYDGKVSVERFKNTFEKVFKDSENIILDY